MSVVTAPTESYRNSRSVHTTRRVSPTREGQLELGQFYHITGQAEGLEQLPAQVFRLERLERTSYSGSRILTGTLWWRVWVNGRWYSGVLTDHILADHHVNLGSRTNGLPLRGNRARRGPEGSRTGPGLPRLPGPDQP